MATTSGWLNRLRSKLSSSDEGLAHPSRPRTGRKPRLESLERRWVLNYSITNVGTIGSFSTIGAINGLNNNGAVVGASVTASNLYVNGFWYRHGKIRNLGSLGESSLADGINDRGTIVGISDLFPNTSSEQDVVFIYQRGRIAELAPLSTPNAVVGKLSINDRGEVTGFSDANGEDVLVRNGNAFDIGSLNGLGSVANELSNSGEVVGYSLISTAGYPDEFAHAFAYSRGKMKDLGTLGGTQSEADGVNDKGVVVGSSLIAGNTIDHPFVYENGKMTDLGTLGGPNGFAHSINDKGVIVGSADVPSGGLHAFIYRNGVMTDLNSLIPANSGYVLYRGLAINNRGQIEVETYAPGEPNGPFSTVLLTPTKGTG